MHGQLNGASFLGVTTVHAAARAEHLSRGDSTVKVPQIAETLHLGKCWDILFSHIINTLLSFSC